MQGTMQIESSQHNLETFPTVKTIRFTEGKKKKTSEKKTNTVINKKHHSANIVLKGQNIPDKALVSEMSVTQKGKKKNPQRIE